MKTTRALMVGLVLLVVLTAAGAVAATQPSDVAGPDIVALASAAAQEGLESQAEILADGRVTFAEYRQAVKSTVGCLKAAGFDARANIAPDDSGFVITVSSLGAPQADTAEEAMASMDAAYDTCDRQYKRLVEGVYRTVGR